MQSLKKYNNNYLFIILTWFVINFPILFNNGTFWDDWSLIDQPLQTLYTAFNLDGTANAGLHLIHYYLLKLFNQNVIGYRIFTIILYGLIWCLFYKILLKIISNGTLALLSTLMCCVLPLNITKFYGICFPYTLHLLLLLLGINGIINWFFYNKKDWYTIPFLLISFVTNSILVFYYGILASLIFIIVSRISLKSLIFTQWKNLLIFGLLPIIFWIFRMVYLSPSGVIAQNNYNKIKIEHLKTFASELWDTLLQIINYSISFSIALLIVALPIAFMIVYVFKKKTQSEQYEIKYSAILIIAIILIITATIPYILVSKPPYPYGFENRHQLLLPFGISLLLSSLLLLIKQYTKTVFYSLIGLIFGTCIATHLTNLFKLQAANLKYDAIEYSIKQNNFNKHSIILFADSTSQPFPTERKVSLHELNGMAFKVYDTQELLFFEADKYDSITVRKYYRDKKSSGLDEYAKFKDFKLGGNTFYNFKISQNRMFDWNEVLYLSLIKLKDENSYQNQLNKYYSFEIKKWEL